MKNILLLGRLVITGIFLTLTILSFPAASVIQAQASDDVILDIESLSGLPETGNPKLDFILNSLVSLQESSAEQDPDNPLALSIQETGETVRVIVESLPSQGEEAQIVAAQYGMIEGTYGDLTQVVVPVSSLAVLANNEQVKLVRQPMIPLPSITSEGVALVNADDWQAAGYDGTGVKVGILDVGFGGYASLVGTELPASVNTWWAPSVGGPGTNIHGTACAEIIYDMAPGSEFFLANFGSEVEMQNAVTWMIGQGVEVISCSVGYPIYGSGDGTGPICDIIDTAHAAGITWVQSAGNSAQMHWRGNWNDTNHDGFHEFPGSDLSNAITVSSGQTITIGMRWNDTWGSSSNDYDLLLYDKDLKLVAYSLYVQNGNDYPYEIFNYTATYSGVYHIVIGTLKNPAVKSIHLYSYYHNLQYQTVAGSLSIPADSPNAIAVGAVAWNSPNTIRSFSSRGPTDDGRIKPDIVAPDGVSTVSYGTNGFGGTSASAPHTAGAAVLVQQRYPSYVYSQIKSLFETRAIDLGAAGKDSTFGSGRLDLGNSGSYTLLIGTSGNGSVLPSPGYHTYPEYSLISISASPDTNWAFSKWSGDCGTVGDVNSASTTIIIDADYSIIAEFVRTQAVLTIAVDGNGTVSPEVGEHTYDSGSSVTITATPAPDWRFERWSGETGGIADIHSATTTIVMDDDYNISAVFSQPVLTMCVDGDGTTTPSVGVHSYPEGSTVDISAFPDTDWAFDHWSSNTAQSLVLRPNGTGSETSIDTQYPDSGFHFDKVDEVTCDQKTTYVHNKNGAVEVAITDLYTLQDCGMSSGFINGVTVYVCSQHNGSKIHVATKTYDTVYKIYAAGTTSWTVTSGTWTTNPHTGEPWTWEEINDLEIGFSLTRTRTDTTISYCSQVYAVVDYTSLEIADINSPDTTIAINGDCTVTAHFVRMVRDLSLSVEGNGTVLPDVGVHTYAVGATIDITATPDSGWRFVEWAGDTDTIVDVHNPETTVTMDDDYSLIAVFSRPVLTISVSGNGTVTPGSGSHAYDMGTIVDISAVPEDGYNFIYWTGDVADPGSPSTTVVLDADKSVRAYFVPAYLTLDMRIIGNGTTIPSAGNHTISTEDPLVISAIPDSNWAFDHWSVEAEQSLIFRPNGPGSETSIGVQAPSSGYHFDKVDEVTCDQFGTYLYNQIGAVNVPKRDLFSIPDPSSVSGTLTGVTVCAVSQHNGSKIYVSIKTHGTVYDIYAGGTTSWALSSGTWNVNPYTGDPWTWEEINDLEIGCALERTRVDTHISYCSQVYAKVSYVVAEIEDTNSAETTIILHDDCVLTAHFVRTHANLMLQVEGKGIVSPENQSYPLGSCVTISAVPDPGWRFVRWSGQTGTVANIYDAVTSVTINNDYTITAIFARPVLTMAVSGGGTVVPEAGIYTYDAGTLVDISAVAAENWKFLCWIGDVTDSDSMNTSVLMDTDKTVIASFTRTHGTLMLLTTGSGTTNPDSGTIVTHAVGTPVNITATPAPGWRFSGWVGDIGTVIDTNDASTDIIINGDYVITAVFTRPVLAMSINGSGSVSPACGNHAYDIGTSVNITAVASSGWQFTRWTGDTVTIADVNSSSTNVTMNDDYTITAVFTAKPVPPPSGGGGGGPSGGGGGGTDDKRFTNISGSSSADGTLWEDVLAQSVDVKAQLLVSEGTVALNRNGYPIFTITVATIASPQDANPGTARIGEAYEFTPEGSTFSPQALLTLFYDDDMLPEGVSEGNLCIALWNEETQTWEQLECTIDTITNTVSAYISHFSRYTILTGTRPADFSVAGLALSPGEAYQGDTITVSATVSNSGDLAGSRTLSLLLDGVEVRTQSITLDGGESRDVNFTITAGEPGTYVLSLEGRQGRFTVIEEEMVFPIEEDFIIEAMTITPEEVDPGEDVTVSCTITNASGAAGRTDVSINLNGTIGEMKSIILEAGESQDINFVIASDVPGKNLVQIKGKLGSFMVVTAGEVAQVEPSPLPHTTQAVSSAIATSTPSAGTKSTANWPLIAGIGGAVIVVGVCLAVVVIRRRNSG